MFDPTSNEFWLAVQAGIFKVLDRPGMQIQLYLSAVAIAISLLTSLLVQRLALRKIPPASKYHWLARDILPGLLSPLLLIIMLLIAAWIAMALGSQHASTVTSFVKIAMVWFVARALLLVAQRHFMAYLISSVMLALALLSVTDLLAPTQASLNDIAFETSTFRLSLLGVVKGTFTLIVLFWGAGVLSKTGENWLSRLNLGFNARELASKFLRITLYVIASILTLNELGVSLTALTVFGGALAVGLGFGLQKITSNFISGIILLFEKTIQIGDLIEVGNEKGWVRKMGIRHILIETSDGREVLIPNEDLITNKVMSWTYSNPRARVEVVLNVTYNSDLDLVQKLMLAAAHAYPTSLPDPVPACYLREFGDRGMQFQLAFWIPDIKIGLNAARSEVMLRVVRAFREHNVTFAITT